MLLAPTLDGEETSYFEWLGAGVLVVRDVAGAMHQTDRQPTVVSLVHYGFDRAHLYVRVDSVAPAIDVLAGGREISLTFVTPGGVRFSVRQTLGRLAGAFWERQLAEPGWVERGPGGAIVAGGMVLELAIPISELGVAAGQPVRFFVAVSDERGAELERHPVHRPIELIVPDALFEARQWRA